MVPNHPLYQLSHTPIFIRFLLILRRSGTNCGQTRFLRFFVILQSAENARITRLFRTFDFLMRRSLFTLPNQARYQLRYTSMRIVYCLLIIAKFAAVVKGFTERTKIKHVVMSPSYMNCDGDMTGVHYSLQGKICTSLSPASTIRFRRSSAKEARISRCSGLATRLFRWCGSARLS